MSFKEKVFTECLSLLADKIKAFREILNDLEAGSESDNKSSAGDKHETARAMMQLEQEKISKQLTEALALKTELENCGLVKCEEIKKGALVKTDRGYIFFAISLGKISVESTPVMILSLQSPVGTKLAGLKSGNSAEFNGIAYLVEEIR